jgi:hypothetical protein
LLFVFILVKFELLFIIRLNKNEKSLLFTTHLLLFSQHVFSQKIAGFVHNSHNEPIAGVSVSILKTTKGVSTDPEGRFQIEGVSTGRYTLKFTFVGFEPLLRILL